MAHTSSIKLLSGPFRKIWIRWKKPRQARYQSTPSEVSVEETAKDLEAVEEVEEVQIPEVTEIRPKPVRPKSCPAVPKGAPPIIPTRSGGAATQDFATRARPGGGLQRSKSKRERFFTQVAQNSDRDWYETIKAPPRLYAQNVKRPNQSVVSLTPTEAEDAWNAQVDHFHRNYPMY